MNRYFEYQDFAKVDRSIIGLSTSSGLQAGSNIENLRKGVIPYDFASFEKDSYITSNPKIIAPKTKKLGFLTKSTSDGNGNVNANILIDLKSPCVIPGVTLGCINTLSSVEITYISADNSTIRTQAFDSDYITSNLQFFNMASEGVSKISITIKKTDFPYRFVGIYRVDLGSIRIFDATNLVGAQVTSHYSIDGSTIEYDVMKATIYHEDDTEYIFTKKQPVFYKTKDEQILHKFYIEKGEQTTDNTISLTAYDSVALLEGKFLGGIYGFNNVYTDAEGTPYDFNQLLEDIFSGTDVVYKTEDTEDIKVSGYIPICTRRKAVALLCKGTNVRCVKEGGTLVFRPISSGSNINYDNSVIVENPKIKSMQKVGKLTVKKHNYKKSNEEAELFNWYLQQGENTMQLIEFSEPVWKIHAYEVLGVDEDGFDIISETPSKNVIFEHSPQDTGDEIICNYCVVKSANTRDSEGKIAKVIIKGWRISDNTESYVVNRLDIDSNAEYDEINVDDVTISKCTTNSSGKIISSISEIGKLLFAIANNRKTQEFEVVNVESPQVGDNVSTSILNSPLIIESDKGDITYNTKITYTSDDLSDVYKVVIE